MTFWTVKATTRWFAVTSARRRYAVRCTTDLVAEVASPRDEHGRSGRIDGGHDLGVTDRAARLDEARDAGREADLDGVGERKEGIGRTGRSAQRGVAADRPGLVHR